MHLKLINLKTELKIKWKHLNFQGNEWLRVMRIAEPPETNQKTIKHETGNFYSSYVHGTES